MPLHPLPSTGFKPRHTAAPWTARSTDLGDGALWITGKPNTEKAAALIAVVATGNPEQEANALLLSEAPTLLYELRNLIDAITHAEQTHEMHDLLQYRDLALKKVSKHLQPSKTPV